MRYADVVVDLSADAVDRFFTYAVPDDMPVGPGWQVNVPFGPRALEGFVVRMKDSCDLPPNKVKPIRDCVRDYAVVLPDLMELSDWMHKRYVCNRVDTLRLMIPAKMRGDRVHEAQTRFAHLTLNAEEARAFIENNKRAKAQCALVESLLEGDKPTPELNSSALRALVEKGAVVCTLEERFRTPASLKHIEPAADPELMPEQKRAVDQINAALEKDGGRFLLNGVTGSGKTEVYIRVIRHALAMGKSAIVLVPEIALTPQMVSWLHARFGDTAAVLHSRLSDGERYDEWRRIRFGKAKVVIGARSAVFAPVENLGVIVVDEEHEHTYQSDKRPRYDAREVARHRAESAGAVLILGSATPSVETYMRVQPTVRPENRLELIELRQRVKGRPLPEVDVVDMRGELEKGNRSIFSTKLLVSLKHCLAEGRQAILFMNRRGYSTFVSCRACGYVVKCGQCDVSMTYHRTDETLRCHYCGATQAPPKVCPQCGSRYIKYFGVGTQQVEEEVKKCFPEARTVRMDNDTTRQKDAHEKLIDEFRSGRANVMIGTQMIAKGLDFPNVTLVGVIAADATLNLPDYRSVERTFQLLTQVSGRAGRADVPGKVVIQTYDPDHYGIRLAAKQDFRAFYEKESVFRRRALYPPFTVIARIVYTAKTAEQAQAAAEADAEKLDQWIDETGIRRDVIQMRALEAPISLLRGMSRWQIFMKVYFRVDMNAVAVKMQSLADSVPDGISAEVEINPTNLF
ncbi:MAG: primosomal protein N' [Clostridia bacterium]|nr:primosomal protein N' [Clostridia bacterium]